MTRYESSEARFATNQSESWTFIPVKETAFPSSGNSGQKLVSRACW